MYNSLKKALREVGAQRLVIALTAATNHVKPQHVDTTNKQVILITGEVFKFTPELIELEAESHKTHDDLVEAMDASKAIKKEFWERLYEELQLDENSGWDLDFGTYTVSKSDRSRGMGDLGEMLKEALAS